MLLACSITNSAILLGVFDEDRLIFHATIASSRERSSDELAILIDSIFRMHHADKSSVTGAIVASVVRPLTAVMSRAIETLFGLVPLLVGPGVKTGLNIKTDIPSQVGADIVANAVAAVTLVKSPLVFIDFGAATTLTGINSQGELTGVLIGPGVQTSLDALSARAAELPSMSLEVPRSILGKNTHDAMTGGFIHGHAAMIDGLLDRIATSWDTMELSVVATGELAEKILPFCSDRHPIRYEPFLPLIGLKLIHHLNYPGWDQTNPRRCTHRT